jgi:hypothetical protein
MSIGINIEKAKDIQRDRWRAARTPLIAALDVQFMQALESGDTAAQTAIVAQKNALRDVTDTPFPSDIPADIAAFWPACLNG